MSWVWNRQKQRPGKVDWNTPVLPAGADRLQALYDWERPCRGYDVFPYPVPLEPPFVPFEADGRIEAASPYSTPRQLPHNTGSDLAFLSLLLPPEQKVSTGIADSLLRAWQGLRSPLSFEVVADSREIAFQFACQRSEGEEVASALRMHCPLAEFGGGESCSGVSEDTDDTLRRRLTPLRGQPLGYQAVDFGLLHFSFQPLQRFSAFATDPLAALVGSLSQLQRGEVAGLQVLLAPARGNWPASLLRLAGEFDSEQKVYGESLPVWQARQKTASPLFACVVRAFGVSVGGDSRAFALCQKVGGTLGTFSEPNSNELVALDNAHYPHEEHFRDLLNRQSRRQGILLSAAELVGLVHPPSEKLQHPKLLRLDPNRHPLPEHVVAGRGAVLGLYRYRDEEQAVAWPDEYRNRHCYTIGATRMGKSTLLLNLIAQDLRSGRGLCLIDPHGDLANDVLERVPPERMHDVLYLDFADREHPPAMGLLEASDEWEQRLIASDVLSVLRRLFASSWGDRLEHILRHALLTLLSEPGHTLRDIRPLLADKEYRNAVLRSVRDPELRAFWHSEFPGYSSSTFSPVYNKLGLVLSSPLVRNIVAQKESRLPLGEMMAEKKVLIVNLSSNLVGADNAHFLGALLVSKIQIAAMQNLRRGRAERTPFTLYVDEFQNFLVSSFEKILSEAGKAGLSLVMANQFLEQLSSGLQTAILGNVGTLLSFRVSADSGRLLEKEFAGRFTQSDVVGLNRGEAVARIGSATDSFRLHTLPPPQSTPAHQSRTITLQIMRQTHELCCRSREEVEAELAQDRLVEEREEERRLDEKEKVEKEERANRKGATGKTSSRDGSTGNSSNGKGAQPVSRRKPTIGDRDDVQDSEASDNGELDHEELDSGDDLSEQESLDDVTPHGATRPSTIPPSSVHPSRAHSARAGTVRGKVRSRRTLGKTAPSRSEATSLSATSLSATTSGATTPEPADADGMLPEQWRMPSAEDEGDWAGQQVRGEDSESGYEAADAHNAASPPNQFAPPSSAMNGLVSAVPLRESPFRESPLREPETFGLPDVDESIEESVEGEPDRPG
jgi:hypothetical protein